jgi:hypothetical protein
MSSQDERKPKDPIIEAQIERTLKPYIGVATPEMLQTMREELEEMLTTHPTAVGLLNQLRDRAAPLASGDVPKEGAEPEGKTGEGKEGA